MNNFLKREKEKAMFLGFKIKKYYQSLNVNINVTRVQIISHLKRYIYEIELLPGAKVNSIFTCASDVKAALRLSIFYPFKKERGIFIAVSELDIKENSLLNILRSSEFSNSKMQIPIALGYNLMGNMYITDLEKLVHLLIIGSSGTGKSVTLQCIILSILVKCPVDSVRLILFDIGANSLSQFSNVKQLYYPIIKDINTGIIVLESLVAEIEKRLSDSEYNNSNIPFCICIIDEFDDTIASIEDKIKMKRFTSAINSIIRRGRKAKIILILVSHDLKLLNDNKNQINTKTILSRIVFQCFDHYSSSTALGDIGAENLSGEGVMLFKSQKEHIPIQLQGAYVAPKEIEEILNNAPIGYDDINMLEIQEPMSMESMIINNIVSKKDKKELADILFWVLSHTTISATEIKKQFKIGNRVNEIINTLNKLQIITEKNSNQPRKVIPICIDDLSSEAKELLEYYGYTTEQIKEKLEAKKGER